MGNEKQTESAPNTVEIQPEEQREKRVRPKKGRGGREGRKGKEE